MKYNIILKSAVMVVLSIFANSYIAIADTNADDVKVVPADEAKVLYGKYGDTVYQVQVIDLASGEKTSIGSGFQISKDGWLATNYHVVAEKIHRSKNNRIDFTNDEDAKGSLEIIYVDVINDLAILQMSNKGDKFLSLEQGQISRGSRIFSIGNPHDIGFTIIEGTYNGVTRDGFIDKIHFSGSLNSGMSGGPAINHSGKVVGINVATSGNQVSFLVPVEKLSELIRKAADLPEGYRFIENANEEIQKQILANQNRNITEVLNEEWTASNFGGMQMPSKISDRLRCWGGINHKDKDDYNYYYTMCSGQDRIFIDNKFYTGALAYRHNHIVGKENISPMQFYNFYKSEYRRPAGDYKNARDEDVTDFACNDSHVKIAKEKWKASLCVRRYKKYPKLFDMHLYMAKLGEKMQGLTSVLIGQGLSEENILKLSESFIKEIKPLTTEEGN